MTYLYLFRHAKAEPGAEDAARPLTARGLEDARAVAQGLVREFPRPRLILTSPATRTRQTLTQALPILEPAMVLVEDRLYLASAHEILALVQEQASDQEPLMVIGHNNSLSHCGHLLVNTGAAADIARLAAGLPTAGLAVLRFEQGWRDLAAHTGHLARLFHPAACRAAAP